MDDFRTDLRKPQVAIALTLCIAVTGCSVFVPWNQTVRVVSDPPHATLFVNSGRVKGTSPWDVSVRRDLYYTFEVRLEGYYSAVRRSGPRPSIASVIDKLLFWPWVLTSIIDCPGAWRQDKDVINVKLMKPWADSRPTSQPPPP